MKFNKIFTAATLIAASMSVGSCTGDLDLEPTSPNDITTGTFPSDPKGYMEKAIGFVYQDFATYGYGTNADGSNILTSMDGGMSTFQRAVFTLQEIPTDEANWLPSGDAIDANFQYGVVPDNNTVVMGSYSRFMVNVALCNNFLQNEFGCTTDEEIAIREEFRRQARILRAACYYYLIDCFGNVPWATEEVGMGEIAPQLSTDFAEGRRLVFDAVVNDLEDIVAYYKENDPNNRPPYGYVGLDVAESLLVKFYLNAGVYTGTERWKECYDHAEAVIARLGKGGFVSSTGDATGLCYGYHQNFAYNNKAFAIGGASDINEIIWDIPQESATLAADGLGLKSYANGGFMCNAWIGDAPGDADFSCAITEYNSANGWKCMSARTQFVEVFDWDDATMSTSPDIRTKFWKTSKDGFNIQNGVFDQANWGNNGYLAVKFTNWYINDFNEIDEDMSPAAVDPLGIDYGMIRLAEIYLSAAEAALNGGGDVAKALKYTNYIRERAGMDAYSSINLTELQRERQRELYTECTRRTDLIRYGKWISGYTWNWKYKQLNGRDYPSNFNVYPLPATVVTRNGYVQNPGY